MTLASAQICNLPPGTISDITNEHNLTVHWMEKHTHRDCALYTGDACSLDFVSFWFYVYFPLSHCKLLPFKAVARAGVGTPLQISNCSGTHLAYFQKILDGFFKMEEQMVLSCSVGVNSQWRRLLC